MASHHGGAARRLRADAVAAVYLLMHLGRLSLCDISTIPEESRGAVRSLIDRLFDADSPLDASSGREVGNWLECLMRATRAAIDEKDRLILLMGASAMQDQLIRIE